jgi:hypothetical protein
MFAVAAYPVGGTSRHRLPSPGVRVQDSQLANRPIRLNRGGGARDHLDAMKTGHPGVLCDLSRDRKPHSHSAMDLQAHRAERIAGYALIDRTNWARLWAHLFP